MTPFAETTMTRTEERDILSAEHAARIATRLLPDPREWTVDPEVIDAGPGAATGFSPPRCACGHPIRYLFTLRRARDGATATIGNVCIDTTVPVLLASSADAVAARLLEVRAAWLERRAEEERRARDAAASAEVQALLADWQALKEHVHDARELYPRYSVPEVLYRGIGTVKAASTPGRTAAAIKTRYCASWESLFALAAFEDREGHSPRSPLPPLPATPALAAKLVKSYADPARKARAYLAEHPDYHGDYHRRQIEWADSRLAYIEGGAR